MSSRIEQIIEEIEEYVDSCKFQPLSSTKIVVNKEELEELLRELRMKTPDEIKRYQKIISNKDAILADAQSKADAIIADAKTQAQQMVTESEVMQQAYAQSNELLENTNQQAQEIMDNATTDANNIRMGAGKSGKDHEPYDRCSRREIQYFHQFDPVLLRYRKQEQTRAVTGRKPCILCSTAAGCGLR